MPENKLFKKVAIIGLGLIGGSIARAVRERGVATEIVAADRNPLALQFALQQTFIDAGFESPEQAVLEADLVILATPPSVLGEVTAYIADYLAPGVLVMDTASVKCAAIDAVAGQLEGKADFIPAHPIAGSEETGVAAGKASLFVGRQVILTPSDIDNLTIPKAMQFWQALGAEVEFMPPETHDLVYAYVSHLPQLLAFALKEVLQPHMEELDKTPLLRQFTRLCGSDLRLWEDIFESNQHYLDQALAKFFALFAHMRTELAEGAAENGSDALINSNKDMNIIYNSLLPRLVASCLIVAITQEERSAGFRFSRFSGQGFKDFSAPAMQPPDNHLENISNHAVQVVQAMDEVMEALSHWIVIKN